MAIINTEDRIGNEDSFHITVRPSFGSDGCFDVTVWPSSHGSMVPPEVRGIDKAMRIAQFLYDELFPEFIAGRERQKEQYRKFEAEQSAKPKPKPVKVPKNAPRVDVLECSDCSALILPNDVSDDKVYECSNCGPAGTGDDARQCDQCHRFTAKVSDTSCPECSAAMDEAETVQARRATNGELVKYPLE